jgi:hypothetical protein
MGSVKGFTPTIPSRAREDVAMICRDFQHFLPSADAGQRAVLDGFGYCKAAPEIYLLARFFRADRSCWLFPVRFAKKFKAAP